ncbi:gliding motility-associated C-terminal domain-containing protein [Mucilaginibacter flavus]|uniref:T9SS type B sorting domain-containing protein n=1 Tax=Mucilaginibacter flavus TaxID=931504 RepID=UPI0025B2F68B|nr:gliding motility-associated C-terminal domain-containing protein [Mucilaginibacter flavus]MDN3582608.1 gliding motility-associated C-terminal domain-containing protein [Mucilaginibacter flavus]
MHKYLLAISIFFLFHPLLVFAQTSQTVKNGSATTAINFTGSCNYTWFNDNSSIGLSGAGTGSIPSFIAVNTGSTTVTATVTVTATPTQYAYVLNADANTGSVTVVDAINDKVLTTITDGIGKMPVSAVITPDGSKVYVTCQQSNTVVVIDTKTNAVTATIPVAAAPANILISPDGTQVFVSHVNDDKITAINTSNNAVTRFSAGDKVVTFAISANGKTLYVQQAGGTIAWIDANTNSHIVRFVVYMGKNAAFMTVSTDGKFLYASYPAENLVLSINTATYVTEMTVPVDPHPGEIALDKNGSLLYVTNSQSNEVSVIDLVAKGVTNRIPVGNDPVYMSISPDGSKLYAGNLVSNTVSVVSIAEGKSNLNFNANKPYKMVFAQPSTDCGNSPITYTITVTPTLGGTTNMDITVPDAFSPNGDGQNDTWIIKNLENYPNNTVDIYNRYGEKVYSSIGYSVPWNGRYKGVDLPFGTYYYIINPKNGRKIISGNVTIIR